MSSTVSKQTRITTRQLTMTALFVALIAVGAFIRVPLPNCPFTLQILFTTLAGIVLGSRLGAASVGIYIVLGLIGYRFLHLVVVLVTFYNLPLAI